MLHGGLEPYEDRLGGRDVRDMLLAAVVLVGLAATELHSYLLFYGLAQVFSIVIASAIFMVAWNARRFAPHNYLLLLGVAYLFVAILDTLYMLAYPGMDVFHGYGRDLYVKLWIGARAMQAITLLLVPAFVTRKVKANIAFPAYALATVVLLLSIFYWRVFPACFDRSGEVAPFRRIAEYVICAALFGSLVWLHRRRRAMDRRVAQLLAVSIAAALVSELPIAHQVNVYDWRTKLGQLLKIVSFYLVYKAVIERTLVAPYATLFSDLRQTQESLRVSGVRFRRLVEEVGTGILVLGRTGEVRYINPAAEALLGMKAHEIQDKPFVFPAVPGRTAEIRVERGDKPTVKARMRVVQTSWEGEPCRLVSLHTVEDA
jgi:PAS domain-containing protein